MVEALSKNTHTVIFKIQNGVKTWRNKYEILSKKLYLFILEMGQKSCFFNIKEYWKKNLTTILYKK